MSYSCIYNAKRKCRARELMQLDDKSFYEAYLTLKNHENPKKWEHYRNLMNNICGKCLEKGFKPNKIRRDYFILGFSFGIMTVILILVSFCLVRKVF